MQNGIQNGMQNGMQNGIQNGMPHNLMIPINSRNPSSDNQMIIPGFIKLDSISPERTLDEEDHDSGMIESISTVQIEADHIEIINIEKLPEFQAEIGITPNLALEQDSRTEVTAEVITKPETTLEPETAAAPETVSELETKLELQPETTVKATLETTLKTTSEPTSTLNPKQTQKTLNS